MPAAQRHKQPVNVAGSTAWRSVAFAGCKHSYCMHASPKPSTPQGGLKEHTYSAEGEAAVYVAVAVLSKVDCHHPDCS